MSAARAGLAVLPAVTLGRLVDRLAGGWAPHRRPADARRLGTPAVAVAAVLVAACVARFGAGADGLVACALVCVLVLLALIDLECHVLPNRIVLPATALFLAAQLALAPERAPEWLLAGLGAALCLLAAHAASPAGMGMGDVKLALLLGVALGSTVAVALAVAVAGAAVAAGAVLVRRGRAWRRTALPFGPFLALGAVVALFAGDRLLALYLATL